MSEDDPLDIDDLGQGQLNMITRAVIVVWLDAWRVIMRHDKAHEHVSEFLNSANALVEMLLRLHNAQEEPEDESEPPRDGTTH